MIVDGGADIVDDGGGGDGFNVANDVEETVFAEFFPGAVHGFGESVGVEEKDIAGSEGLLEEGVAGAGDEAEGGSVLVGLPADVEGAFA